MALRINNNGRERTLRGHPVSPCFTEARYLTKLTQIPCRDGNKYFNRVERWEWQKLIGKTYEYREKFLVILVHVRIIGINPAYLCVIDIVTSRVGP